MSEFIYMQYFMRDIPKVICFEFIFIENTRVTASTITSLDRTSFQPLNIFTHSYNQWSFTTSKNNVQTYTNPTCLLPHK